MRQDSHVIRAGAGLDPDEFTKTIVPMFGQVVALLAMKYGRAPLPVSAALLRRMIRSGFPTDIDELTNFARRYLFLRDERMLLLELKQRSIDTPVKRSVFREMLLPNPQIAEEA